MNITVGGNFRLYTPNSHGTIFSDTNGRKITNYEYGIYGGAEKKLMGDQLKLNLTVRMDKNENFNYLFSPALSAVYTYEKHIFRVSLSSAIRNPTLVDQYLYYNVGRAILVGNLNGFDSLVTVPSLLNFFDTQRKDTLDYFNVHPVQPEQVKTIEAGWRASLWQHVYIDAEVYYSFYKNFIGYNLGAAIDYNKMFNRINSYQVYRVAANATSTVTTQGANIGITYYFRGNYSLDGNYSYNHLNKKGADDPLIPAFNTPLNKYNLGFSGRDLSFRMGSWRTNHFGFSINYKWVQGYLFEGSPQFTGAIPSYGLVDAQITKAYPQIYLTMKLGASNLLNNYHYEVYGGPAIGRLAYLQIIFNLPVK
jgi:outer membrane receptor for ferrienterochelin and colicin